MTRTFIRLKPYDRTEKGRKIVDVDHIIGWAPKVMGNTETKIYLQGGPTVVSYESTESFEERFTNAVNRNIFIQE